MPDLFANRQWRVTDYGIESVHPPAPDYFVEKSRLSELDWPEHMAEKTWVDIEAFIEAYEKALELHKGQYSGTITPEKLTASIKEARRVAREDR
jgi:hypothetical protein